MAKPKRLYHTGANVPTDYDYEANKRMLLIVCIPKSTMWIAMYKGLLSLPGNYWFWRLDSTIAHKAVKEGKEVFYRGITMICQDELSYNLREMNFTLKRIENQLCDSKEIKTFGLQPVIAKDENGDIDYSINNTVTNTAMSNFEVGTLLDNNSITDVLKIALLDDGTVGFPDINPFNLESKLDDIRTDINETKLHFTNDFTDLINWFASSFREGTWRPISFLNNPFGSETFYNMLLDTFNDTQKSYTSITLPFWGNVSIPYYVKQHSFIDKLNQNLAMSFNEDFDSNSDIASNSHFRSVNAWLTVDWKVFSDYFSGFATWYTTTWQRFENIMIAIRDCICAIPASLLNGNGTSKLDDLKNVILAGNDSTNVNLSNINSSVSTLQLNPTINNNTVITPSVDNTNIVNVSPSNPVITVNPSTVANSITVSPSTVNPTFNNPITVQPCKPIVMCGSNNSSSTKPLQDIADQIKNLVDLTKDNGSDTIRNPDGSYTTTPKTTLPNDAIDHSKPPVDPSKPINSVTGKPALLDPITGKVLPYDPITGKVINSTVNNPLEDGYNDNPYYKNLIKPSGSYNAKCGFTYKMMTDTADSLEELALWAGVIGNTLVTMGVTAIDVINGATTAISIIGTLLQPEIAPVTVGVNLVKAKGIDSFKKRTEKLVTYAIVNGGVGAILALAVTIRHNAETVACDSGMISNMNKTKFMSLIGTALTGNQLAYFAYEVASDVWDYTNASDTFANILDMNDYKQYCPCPLTGIFNGSFWNGVTGNGEKWLYLESDGYTVTGQSTSKDLFLTQFISEIQNGLVDTNNELSASGILHVISHSGYSDTGFSISSSIDSNTVYYGTPVQTYTRS